MDNSIAEAYIIYWHFYSKLIDNKMKRSSRSKTKP